MLCGSSSQLEDLDKDHKHVFVIDAPSGTGKTQLPFALSDIELKIVQLVTEKTSGSKKLDILQNIYGP